ncbi:MAG: hypothetical protein QXX30_04120 [Candidatus Aenigmatarchaeota archaeon]
MKIIALFLSVILYITSAISFTLEEPIVNREKIRDLARNVTQTGGTSTIKIGNNIYTATFNGYSGNCGNVAVIHTVEGIKGNERIYNYRVCDGEVLYSGRTMSTSNMAINKPEIINPVLSTCKASGYGSYTDEIGRSIECRAVDVQRCFLEIIYYDDNRMMVKKDIINTCR